MIKPVVELYDEHAEWFGYPKKKAPHSERFGDFEFFESDY